MNSVARLLDDPPRLAALSAACALVEAGLPEREPQATVFEDMVLLLDTLERPAWGRTYVRWEVALLGDLGFEPTADVNLSETLPAAFVRPPEVVTATLTPPSR